jgi:hypothetical protein
VLDLLKINADLCRLGVLIKTWLTSNHTWESSSGQAKERKLDGTLKEIRSLQKKMSDRIRDLYPENLTIHDPKADYWIRSKLCAVLEHELGLARDRHNAKERHSRSNNMEAMSGEESFRGWLAQYAQHFLDATNWQEFHGMADAYSVRLQIRANGCVFVDKESGKLQRR